MLLLTSQLHQLAVRAAKNTRNTGFVDSHVEGIT